MHIEYLEEFIVLANCLNFSQAAQQLDTTQSTLSKHIMQMEKEFGTPLLDRDKHSAELTEAGRYLLEESVKIVDSYARIKRVLKTFKPAETLSVGGLIQNPRIISLVSTTASLLRQACGESFQVVFAEETSKPLFDYLLEGTFDLLFTYEAEELPEGVLALKLFGDPFVAIMSSEHPLAGRKSVTLRDLKTESLLQLTGNYFHEGWDSIVRFLKQRGIETNGRAVFANSFFDIATIDFGSDLLVISKSALSRLHFEQNPSYAVKPIANENAFYHVCVYWRDEPHENLADTFANQMTDTVEMVSGAWSDS